MQSNAGNQRKLQQFNYTSYVPENPSHGPNKLYVYKSQQNLGQGLLSVKRV